MDRSAKILLLGKTGVGKSAFINYFLGKKVAESFPGKPVTQDYFIPYEIKDGRFPVKIYDTKGLETLNANDQLNQIIQGIKQRNNSDDIFNWFHTIFYCVSISKSRFEDFEVDFIRRLQKELTQHIHIILTHCDCDTDTKGTILRMRERIMSLLGNQKNIEIFEVVCVNMTKRNGKIVQQYGREIVSERVFDLLVEDIAHKISFNYARALRTALINVADQTVFELKKLIDTIVNFNTLIKLIKDEGGELDSHWYATMNQMEQDFEIAKKDTDQRFNQILKPAAQLYASYRNTVVDSFANNSDLAFDDSIYWSVGGWDDIFDEKAFLLKVFPKMFQKGYVDEEGEFIEIDGESFPEAVKMVATCIGDILGIKKNLKKLIKELHVNLIQSIPPESQLQQEAYNRIVKSIKL